MNTRWVKVLPSVLLLCLTLIVACAPMQKPFASPSSTGGTKGALPAEGLLAFVPNVGQLDAGILFRTTGSGSALFFAPGEVLIPLGASGRAFESPGLPGAGDAQAAVASEQTALLRLLYEGADPAVRLVGKEQLPGVMNYFLGDDPAQWRANIPTYASLAYEELYKGIDLLLSGQEGLLKGTYTIAAGEDAGAIRWRYEGASRTELDQSSGELRVYMEQMGDEAVLTERRPIAWQEIGGQRVEVNIHYAIHEDGSVGFALGRYDRSKPLLIDPTLDYGTYVGGTGAEAAYGVAVDASGCLYLAGRTTSASITPSGAGSLRGGADVFVLKLDPSRTGAAQRVYETIIGGANKDTAHGVAVDAEGRACLTGYAGSSDFPTTPNAYDRTYAGGDDGIVVQLGATGEVLYSTFLGGAKWEDFIQVAVGPTGLIYVTGDTTSSDFPTTSGAFRRALGGGSNDYDAIVAVVNPSLSGAASLVYSSYFGGSGVDEGWAITVAEDIIYFAGNTISTNLPLKNPFQAQNKKTSGWGNAYIAKIDPAQSGNAGLLYATYLGGTGGEVSGGLAVDAEGNIILTGATLSSDFPTTAGSPRYGGGEYDAFLTKLNAEGSQLLFSRLVGGSGNDGARQVVVDGAGSLYITGGTGSANFPLVNPIQATFKGGTAPDQDYSWLGPGDAFVAKFDATGAMTFGTFLGGTGAEAALGIALDQAGTVTVVGGTRSTDLRTANPLRQTNAGQWDVFTYSIGGVGPSPTATPTRYRALLPLLLRP